MGQIRVLNVPVGTVDQEDLRLRIVSYLETHNAMSLATVAYNRPHAASVLYVNQGFDLFFISSPHSRHGGNMATNNRVSATINEDYAAWSDIKGLQLDGYVVQLGELNEHGEIAAAFTTKFSDVGSFFKKPDELPYAVADKVAKVRFYKFRPSKIFYIDNSLGFGHREEMDVS
jgi:uncharacterized protein YhbP (UPF0306 family)